MSTARMGAPVIAELKVDDTRRGRSKSSIQGGLDANVEDDRAGHLSDPSFGLWAELGVREKYSEAGTYAPIMLDMASDICRRRKLNVFVALFFTSSM